ncbi:MAG: hypothetical protein AAF438_10575 [Pseudomonadota bacterium]
MRLALWIVAAIIAAVLILVFLQSSPPLETSTFIADREAPLLENLPTAPPERDVDEPEGSPPTRIIGSLTPLEACQALGFGAEQYDPQTVADVLAASENPEHLLAAHTILRGATESKEVELLEAALEHMPNSPLAHRMALYACEGHNSDFCVNTNWAEEYVKTDPENADAWLALMKNKQRAGDTVGALEAFKTANSAPNHTNYFIDRIRLSIRGMEAASDWSTAIQTSLGLMYAAKDPADSIDVYKICRDMSEIDKVWLDTCLLYGQRLQREAKTLLDVRMASQIEQNAHTILGNTKIAQRLKEERRSQKIFTVDVLAQIFFMDDRVVISDYLDTWKAEGEVTASEFLQKKYDQAPPSERQRFRELVDRCDEIEEQLDFF